MSEEHISIGTVAEQVRSIATDVTEIKQQVATLTSSLERLARMEERQLNYQAAIGRVFETIKEHDSRIKTIELQEPMAKLVQRWVIAGVIGVVGIFGLQVAAIVFQSNKPITIAIDTPNGTVEKAIPRK